MFNNLRFYVLKAIACLGFLFISASSYAVPVYGTPTYFSFFSAGPVGGNTTFLGMFVAQQDTLINGSYYNVQNFSTTADGDVQARALAAIYETPTPYMGSFATPETCAASCWSFQSNNFTNRGASVYYTMRDVGSSGVYEGNRDIGLLTLYNSATTLQIGTSSLANINYSSGPDNLGNLAGTPQSPIAGAPEIDGSLAPKVGFLLGCLFLMFGHKKQNSEPILTA